MLLMVSTLTLKPCQIYNSLYSVKQMKRLYAHLHIQYTYMIAYIFQKIRKKYVLNNGFL